MKKHLFLSLLAMSFITHGLDMNSESPKWSLADANNKEHNFPENNNKTTIILFWATWCPYCKRLMPHLQSVLYQYGEKLDIQLYAMDINDDDGDPAAYIKENGFDFLLFTQAEEVAKLYDVRGTPGLFVYDREGKLKFDLSKTQSNHLIRDKNKSNSQKAAKKAPFWASELRKVLDTLN